MYVRHDQHRFLFKRTGNKTAAAGTAGTDKKNK